MTKKISLADERTKRSHSADGCDGLIALMLRQPAEPDDGLSEAAPIVGDESTAAVAAESPSMVFLRDLAHVSDQAPNAFDLQLAGVAGGLGPDAVPSSPRFQVQRRLGAGGFGTVYEAFDRERNATVALKVLRHRDSQAVAQFKSESNCYGNWPSVRPTSCA